MTASKPTKAQLIPETGGPISVMFNPSQLQYTKSVQWDPQKSNGNDTARQQWTSGNPAQLSFELFFDRYEENSSIRGDIERILTLTVISGELHRPPMVDFVWGDFAFHGVFKQVQITYTMFLTSGQPCRAKVQCSMEEALDEASAGRSSPAQSPDHAKMRRLKRGETLHSIAATEYDDPNEWRRIADANGIDNPLDLTPGAELLIPPIITR